MTKKELLDLIIENNFSTTGLLYTSILNDDFEEIKFIINSSDTVWFRLVPHLKNYIRLKKLSQSCFND
jgi:hypothetical protein